MFQCEVYLFRAPARWLYILVLVMQASAQQWSNWEPQPFLRANDQFGLKLLRAAHKEHPGNIAISPLPISVMFAALEDAAHYDSMAQEISRAFGFGPDSAFGAKMIAARFRKPRPDLRLTNVPPGPMSKSVFRDMVTQTTPEVWQSGAFLYRFADLLSKDFLDRVSDFGFPPSQGARPWYAAADPGGQLGPILSHAHGHRTE